MSDWANAKAKMDEHIAMLHECLAETALGAVEKTDVAVTDEPGISGKQPTLNPAMAGVERWREFLARRKAKIELAIMNALPADDTTALREHRARVKLMLEEADATLDTTRVAEERKAALLASGTPVIGEKWPDNVPVVAQPPQQPVVGQPWPDEPMRPSPPPPVVDPLTVERPRA